MARLDAWRAAWYADVPPSERAPMLRRLEGLRPAEAEWVFVTDVIHHHQVAIAMAEGVLALDPDPHPEVAALARGILRDSGDAIATLGGWLEGWPVPHEGMR